MKTVALDFDAVIHEYTGWKGGVLGKPIKGAKEAIRELLGRGLDVQVYTTGSIFETIRWLDNHDFPKLEVTNEKPLCYVMVDDRAIRFDGKWTPDLIKNIIEFQSYWEKEEFKENLKKENLSKGDLKHGSAASSK